MWTPDPRFPDDPEFYRRVLRYLPTAIVAVTPTGELVYANAAMLALGGWTIEADSEITILDFVHPDDHAVLAKAFEEIAESPGARILGSGRRWAEIYFRIMTADGSFQPVELVGIGGVLDQVVGGIICELRPAQPSKLRPDSGEPLEGVAADDTLTGLANRAAFLQMADAVDLFENRAAIQLDLDDLGRVNHSLGLGGGDAVLRIIADRLQSLCGTSDIIGRTGDDEFSILLGVERQGDVNARSLKLATGILSTLADPIVVAGRSVTMAASIGIAFAQGGISTDHLLTWAEAAMQDAKRAGGSQIKRCGLSFDAPHP